MRRFGTALAQRLGIWGLLAFSLGLMNGCTEPPVACYTPSTNLVDVNAEMSFENCTEPVARKGYVWDFGDGSTSTEVNPTHTYTSEGQYLVSLTAKAGSSVNDDVTKTLVVGGQRQLTTPMLLSFPATNTSGGAWDAGDAPDIALRFSKGGNAIYQTATITNFAAALPFSFAAPASLTLLTPDTWTVTVLDIDGVTEEVMGTATVNLQTYVPNADQVIHLSGNGCRVDVPYSLR